MDKTLEIRAIFRKSWSVSWPMTLIMFFIFLIGITDVYIAGKFGKEIQAAYGVVFQLYFIFGIIANALTVGSVSLISRLCASGRKEELETAIDTSSLIAAAAGLFFSAAGVLFAEPVVGLLNLPGELKFFAVPLMRIYSLGLLFNYLLINSNGILRACGMVRVSLWTMAAVCLLNIALNFLLAFHTDLGFRGIAAATSLSMLCGSLMNVARIDGLIRKVWKFSLPVAKKIFQISWPAGMLQMLWQLGAMALFLILGALPRQRIETIAAFTNGLRIESAIFLPAFAFNLANAVIIGNLLGKHEEKEAFHSGVVTAISGVSIVAVMTLAVMFNARGIAALLSNNGIVVAESIRYIYISLLFEPLMAWGVILAGGLNGAGDTKSVMLIIAGSIWLIRVPLSYLLGIHFGFGAAGVWWAMNASIMVQTVFISWRYFGKRWIKPEQPIF